MGAAGRDAPADPAPSAAPAPAVPFRGRGAAGGFWVLALVLLGVAALFLAISAAVLLRMLLDPVAPPPPEVEDEGDGRSWIVLAMNVLALFSASAGFVAWMVALAVAGLGFGRLARPVLALSGAVAAAGTGFAVLFLTEPLNPGWMGVALLALAVAGLVGTAAAWRRLRAADRGGLPPRA